MQAEHFPASREFIEMLLARLERVPADSIWSHRASGLRGALLKALEGVRASEKSNAEEDRHLAQLTEAAFQVLEAAAREKTARDPQSADA